jgi:signal transduction histidine kinase/CheY-like chemotaxis protein
MSALLKIQKVLLLFLVLLLLCLSSFSMADNTSCPTFQIPSSTRVSLSLKTQETTQNILLGTDIPYDHQGSTCFHINNTSDSTQELSIYLENPRVHHIELLRAIGDLYTPIAAAGMSYPLTRWGEFGAEIIFNISIPAHTVESFSLAAGSIFPYNTQLQIDSTSNIFHTLILQQMLTGILAGFILSLVFYIAVLGLTTREATYIYLFISTLCVTLLQLNDMGMLYVIWPQYPYWNSIDSGIFTVASTVGGIGLARSFLVTKLEAPRCDYLLKGIFWYTIACITVPFFKDHNLFYFIYALPTMAITLPALVIISLIRMYQGYSPAKLYLLALSAPVIAGILIFMMYAGYIPSSQVTRVLPLVGTAIQLILFGFALGKQITWMKNKKNESENLSLQAKTENESKKTFLSHVSHELRSPLTSIIGLSDIAKKNPIYADNQLLIDGIQSSAEHLLTTISILLDLARLESGKWRAVPSAFDCRTLIQDIASKNKSIAIKKNIVINCHIEDSVPDYIFSDRIIIEKIINGIIWHSIDSMKDGCILLKVDTVLIKHAHYLRIDIIDTGKGVPEDYKQRIFEIFELEDASTTRIQQGVGASLPLSYRLCKLLDGKMGFETSSLYGTAFWCSIPYQPATAPEAPVAEISHTVNSLARQDSANKTILAAEDDEALQWVIASQLDTLHHPYRMFPNGKPLVDEYINNPQLVALVLLDWNMPICNASEAIRLIRHHESTLQLPSVPIAVLSAYDSVSARELNLPANVFFIQKPVALHDLKQLLSTIETP